MTFAGKIFVIVIMVFAMFFLALSTVVFTTAENWKKARDEVKAELSKKSKAFEDVSTAKAKSDQDLVAAKDESTKQIQAREDRIKALESEAATIQKELTEIRSQAGTATENMKAALAEAADRKAETDQQRKILATVQQQANEYQIRQTELNDEIRQLKRQLETATGNNKDLRERVNVLASALNRAGLSSDVTQLRGVNTVPPDVEGEIKRVDARNSRVEISIGSDDGLVVGHELEVWRTKPSPEYLGRIRIEAVDPDQAVGSVIGKTVNGKKIQEGDLVSPKIRPRS